MSKEKFYYGTGRRKTSTARVFLKPGRGKFTVNRKSTLQEYFVKANEIEQSLSPLKVLNLTDSFDVFVTVKGGGGTGQAGAIKMGLARALLQYDESHRPALKSKGLLTRDSRMVERKKYGLHKARKSTQFSKR